MTFTAHAQERMYALAIEPEVVHAIVNEPQFLRFGRNYTVNFTGTHDGHRIRVVINPWDDIVLTVSFVDTIGKEL